VIVAIVLASADGNCDTLMAFLTVMLAVYSGEHIVTLHCFIVTVLCQLAEQCKLVMWQDCRDVCDCGNIYILLVNTFSVLLLGVQSSKFGSQLNGFMGP